jgi:acid phosphatase class B
VYLDLNADLVRRSSPGLVVARKEFMPQQRFFKHPDFYYAVARRIETRGFDEDLARRLGEGAKL